jgi:hypothetical protein
MKWRVKLTVRPIESMGQKELAGEVLDVLTVERPVLRQFWVDWMLGWSEWLSWGDSIMSLGQDYKWVRVR